MTFVKKSNTYEKFAFASVHTSDPTFSHRISDLYNRCQRFFSESQTSLGLAVGRVKSSALLLIPEISMRGSSWLMKRKGTADVLW